MSLDFLDHEYRGCSVRISEDGYYVRRRVEGGHLQYLGRTDETRYGWSDRLEDAVQFDGPAAPHEAIDSVLASPTP